MAVVGIWKITKRLDTTIKYTTDINKTDRDNVNEEELSSLHSVISYTKNDFKTEKQFYVSGINCTPQIAYKEMLITKKRFNKSDGILGFHAFQSFKEGEVTPKIAHEIGVRLAQEMWGDRFEVIVSTHLNTDNYHNHFVINSVSFKDGKKYYDKRETYAELRHLSDSLCEEYGLNVLEEKPCKKSKINYTNYYQKSVEHSNYHTLAKKDIDYAITQALSYNDFERLLRLMEYQLIYRAGKLSIRREPYKRNIRIIRSFGEEYSVENICKRIEKNQEKRLNNIATRNSSFKPKCPARVKHRSKGIKALYFYYCYLLKVFPKYYPNKPLPASIRVEVNKMEIISKETRMLVSNNINTYEQFLTYKNTNLEELHKLQDKRYKLWDKHKRTNDIGEKMTLKNEINYISSKIEQYKENKKLCEGIEERIPKIESQLNEVEEKNILEKETCILDEYIK